MEYFVNMMYYILFLPHLLRYAKDVAKWNYSAGLNHSIISAATRACPVALG